MQKTINLFMAGGDYQARSAAVSAQQMLNLIPEIIEDPQESAKGKIVAYGIPGTLIFRNLTAIDAAATPLRGSWTGDGRVFVAAGTKFFEIDVTGALVGSVYTINDDATHTRVSIKNNGNSFLIVSAGVVYCLNAGTLTTISFPASTGTVDTIGTVGSSQVNWVSGDKFTPSMEGQTITINAVAYTVAQFVTEEFIYVTGPAGNQTAVAFSISELVNGLTGEFLGGYFLVNRTNINARQVNFSNLNNGVTWDALDYFQKEQNPDALRSILVSGSQLYLFGEESFEIWQNTGTGIGGNPFERINSAGDKFGSISPWGPISFEGEVFFVGGSPDGGVTAYQMNGFTPQRISTHGEESQWAAAGLGPNCRSYGYREEGHSYWMINFGAETWGYDLTTRLWHKRMKWNGTTFDPYETDCHIYVDSWQTGMHLTGGAQSGVLYQSSMNLYSNNGADVAWRRVTPYNYDGAGCRIYFGRQKLEMETGTTSSGTEPVITREYSDDRGTTWVNPQTAGIGATGNKSRRVFWPIGGSSYDRIWRFTGITQFKVALVNLMAEIDVGSN